MLHSYPLTPLTITTPLTTTTPLPPPPPSPLRHALPPRFTAVFKISNFISGYLRARRGGWR